MNDKMRFVSFLPQSFENGVEETPRGYTKEAKDYPWRH